MNTFSMFFRKYAAYWSCTAVVGLFLSGCGDETTTLSERVSGPASNAALPIRVDATPTPIATASPSLTVTPTNQTPQPTLTPTPGITPTPETKDTALTSKKTPTPQETPTLVEKAVSDNAKSPKQEENAAKTDIVEQDAEAEESDESEAEEEQEESKPPVVTAKGVKLEKIAICSAVKNRNASGAAKEFSYKNVKKIYTWTKFSGIKSPTVIKHHYYLNGKAVGTVKLTLKYSVMRSWSQKSLTPGESVGKWKVVITTDNDKEILAEREFTVVK